MQKIHHTNRRGFTLVELLVVIAIIGVLMGFMMPAIMRARLAAQSASCTNNEKNIALALLNYETGKQRLPYLAKDGVNYSTWNVEILEQMGLGKYAKIKEDGNGGSLSGIPVKEFKCPSGGAAVNGMSYFVNAGPSTTSGYNTNVATPTKATIATSLFFYRHKNNGYKSKTSAIQDGASTTIMLGERSYEQPKRLTGTWTPNCTSTWCTTAVNESSAKTVFGLTWNTGLTGSKTPNAYYPNFPSSKHSNANNIAFADGSVRSIARGIYYNTYCSLMAPNDANSGYSLSYAGDPSYK